MKFPFDIIMIGGLPYVSAWQLSKYARAHSRGEWVRRLGDAVIKVDDAPFILLSVALGKILGSPKNKFELHDDLLAFCCTALTNHLQAAGQVSPLSAGEWAAENPIDAGLVVGPAARKLAEIQRAYKNNLD